MPQLNPLNSDNSLNFVRLNRMTAGTESDHSGYQTGSKAMFKTVNDEISYLNSEKRGTEMSELPQMPTDLVNLNTGFVSSYETVEVNKTTSIEYSASTFEMVNPIDPLDQRDSELDNSLNLRQKYLIIKIQLQVKNPKRVKSSQNP